MVYKFIDTVFECSGEEFTIGIKRRGEKAFKKLPLHYSAVGSSIVNMGIYSKATKKRRARLELHILKNNVFKKGYTLSAQLKDSSIGYSYLTCKINVRYLPVYHAMFDHAVGTLAREGEFNTSKIQHRMETYIPMLNKSISEMWFSFGASSVGFIILLQDLILKEGRGWLACNSKHMDMREMITLKAYNKIYNKTLEQLDERIKTHN